MPSPLDVRIYQLPGTGEILVELDSTDVPTTYRDGEGRPRIRLTIDGEPVATTRQQP